jgi:predicted DNA-binding transcriptional regulator AlpA
MSAENTAVTLDPDAGLDAKEVCALLGIGKTLLYDMAGDGRLGPKPYRLPGARSIRWIRSELLAWRAAGCPRRERWDAIRKGGRP